MVDSSNISDDDSAPESISFDAGKNDNNEKLLKIKEQISSIRESQKKKRIERQEKYIEQKKKKFENLKLDEDVLTAISADDLEQTNKKIEEKPSKKIVVKNSIKRFSLEEDIKETTLSDFIPLKTFSTYGISVINLADTNKKPLIGSDKAKDFKLNMLNRNGLKRQTSQQTIANMKKRKFVK